jgi:glycosyltransferase involved in cell wall biosynthesis
MGRDDGQGGRGHGVSDQIGATWGPGDPIVVFGDDWGRFVSTMQHLFRHIALDYPVVWVNGLGHRPPSFSMADLKRVVEKVRAAARPRDALAGSGLEGGGTPVAIIEPRVLPWHDVAAVHYLNSRMLIGAIRRTLEAHGLTRPPVLVTGSPPSVGVVGRLGEVASIYFCMDDFLNFPGVSAKMIAPLERRLLGKVDALVATAKSLTEMKRPASGIVHHLPQGVNYEHFSAPREEPEDLRCIPGPRIGFAGSLHEVCDFPLLRRIAETYPEASVVLVGPTTVPPSALSPLHAPNIHILGLRPYRDLPAYVQHFDVGIIPYIQNARTKAVDPLKLLEYLAAGIPVVSTAIPEAHKYASAIMVAEDDETFVRATGAALSLNRAETRERARAVARTHTWEHRASDLLAILGQLAAAGSRRTPSPS